jgi:2-phosphosulfolactate phosphatase
VVFTTTNGTRAMLHARLARRVLIGAFVNATATYRQLLGEEQIHLLCAGSQGQFTHDDVLLAGMLVERLQRLGGMGYQQNAQAVTARELWLHSFSLPHALAAEPIEPEQLARELSKSPSGKNLLALGLEDDILAAAQIDRFHHAAELDAQAMSIRLVSP